MNPLIELLKAGGSQVEIHDRGSL